MPIVTSTHTMIHTPKSGGTHLTKLLKGEHVAGSHGEGWKLAPKYLAGRTVFAPVRNPWDWYCSWYAHSMRSGSSRGDMIRRLYGKDFRETLYSVTHLEEIPAERWHGERSGILWGPNKSPHKMIPSLGDRGLCTWGYWWMLRHQDRRHDGEWIPDTLVATDRLDEAIGLLGLTNIPKRVNVNPNKPDYRDWYDGEMVEWVRHADRDIIALFGWDGPGSPANAPIRRIAPMATKKKTEEKEMTPAEYLASIGYVPGVSGTRGMPEEQRARVKAALAALAAPRG